MFRDWQFGLDHEEHAVLGIVAYGEIDEALGASCNVVVGYAASVPAFYDDLCVLSGHAAKGCPAIGTLPAD